MAKVLLALKAKIVLRASSSARVKLDGAVGTVNATLEVSNAKAAHTTQVINKHHDKHPSIYLAASQSWITMSFKLQRLQGGFKQSKQSE